MISSRRFIEASYTRLVKTLFTLGLLMLLSWKSWADEEEEVPPPEEALPAETTEAPPAPEEPLPAIEAKTFQVKANKVSKSGRVYLFDHAPADETKNGRILLLRENGANVLAFRVIRTYTDRPQFAASRVRTYGQGDSIPIGKDFTAIEKIRDIYPEFEASAEDKELDAQDLQEIEQDMRPPVNTSSYDPELDIGDPSKIEDPDDSSRRQSEIEEFQEMDRDWNWFSVQFGLLKNLDVAGAETNYFGFGMHYGLTVLKEIFLQSNSAQDSLSFDGAAYYYNVAEYDEEIGDSYTVLPLSGSIRYNIFFSPNFCFFMYGGILYNFVLAGTDSTDTGLTNLASIFPAVGGGFAYRLGPQWFIRADIGLDKMSGGIMLRF